MSTMRINMYENMCVSCGVPFALPELPGSRWRQDGKTFYCPNGHPQHYESHEALLQKAYVSCRKVREDNQRLEEELTRLKHRLEHAEAAAQKGGEAK